MTPVEIRIRKSPPHITFLIDILQKHGRILATTPVLLQKQGVFPAENIFQLKRQKKYQGIKQTIHIFTVLQIKLYLLWVFNLHKCTY